MSPTLTYITYHKQHSNSKSQGFFPPFRDLHAILFSAASGITTSECRNFPALKGRKPKRVLTGRRCFLPRLELFHDFFGGNCRACWLGVFSNDRSDVFVEDFCGDFLNDDSAGRWNGLARVTGITALLESKTFVQPVEAQAQQDWENRLVFEQTCHKIF